MSDVNGWKVIIDPGVSGDRSSIHITAPDGRWAGLLPGASARDDLLYEFFLSLVKE